jgi:hypothetical protein
MLTPILLLSRTLAIRNKTNGERMLQASAQSDPIVEILRLAYRRGLAIQREREATNKAIKIKSLQCDILTVEQELGRKFEETQPAVPTA